MKELGKQFGKRLQKTLNFCNFPFYAVDSDLNHPGFRGITLVAIWRNNQSTGRLGVGRLANKYSKYCCEEM